ncbi:MAG: primosomal protein N' [Flavobacteriales bacterium]|nr:primosomal protein N' [Flavobacteriales bacterium]MCX7768706.1 primosomal protein N' [Flavobacteriales bacterium]MDW8410095.1 primosomal protein N' [Flavobacteriales bacterium]
MVSASVDTPYPLYVDVLLPLALSRPLTYGCPVHWAHLLQVGVRVAVPFRRGQLLAGVVVATRSDPPDYPVKSVEEVLDSEPLLQPWQWDFWQWMADYYMCTLGEVLQAAVPSGLLPQSHTVFKPHPELPAHLYNLSATEYEILELIQARGEVNQEALNRLFGDQQALKATKSLVSKGFIIPEKELDRLWQPRREKFLRLSADYQDEKALSTAFEKLRRAPNQEKALLLYLKLAGFDSNPADGVPLKRILSEDPSLQPAIAALIKKGILCRSDQPSTYISPTGGGTSMPPALTSAQQAALESIHKSFQDGKPALLFGETASGKTEIYAHLIMEVLGKQSDAQVLLLVPEIAITTQLIERFRAYLGDSVAVYHSRFGENNRTEVWLSVLRNQRFRLVIGARSALLLPFAKLRLIVVDEEHDASFHQEEPPPRYQARDCAVTLAQKLRAFIVLGSATPSLESYHNSQKGKYSLVRLTERYGGASVPRFLVVDLSAEKKAHRLAGILSKPLITEMEKCLSDGRQIILFQNRKGYAPVLQCPFCGFVPQCRHCDISLTVYQKNKMLRCRYCGYSISLPSKCPACTYPDLLLLGFGTEKVEDTVQRIFPGVPYDRLDTDVARTISAYRRILERFENGDTRILIGTQMVTKGLDFAQVGLVAILSADTLLHYPDFRAAERTYQLLVQAAGRSGRRLTPGVVVIQTYKPHHPVIQAILSSDTPRFLATELEERGQFRYPPFVRLIKVRCACKDEQKALFAAQYLSERLMQLPHPPVLVGPAPPPVARIRALYLYDLILKILPNQRLLQSVKQALFLSLHDPPLHKKFSGVRTAIWVDP